MSEPESRLRELLRLSASRHWDFDHNAPQNILISDGSGELAVKTFTPFASDLIVAAIRALPVLLDLVDSISWMPMAAEDDDDPAEFAVADPTAYRAARDALRGVSV